MNCIAPDLSYCCGMFDILHTVSTCGTCPGAVTCTAEAVITISTAATIATGCGRTLINVCRTYYIGKSRVAGTHYTKVYFIQTVSITITCINLALLCGEITIRLEAQAQECSLHYMLSTLHVRSYKWHYFLIIILHAWKPYFFLSSIVCVPANFFSRLVHLVIAIQSINEAISHCTVQKQEGWLGFYLRSNCPHLKSSGGFFQGNGKACIPEKSTHFYLPDWAYLEQKSGKNTLKGGLIGGSTRN